MSVESNFSRCFGFVMVLMEQYFNDGQLTKKPTTNVNLLIFYISCFDVVMYYQVPTLLLIR